VMGLVVGVLVLWRLALVVSTLATLLALVAALLDPAAADQNAPLDVLSGLLAADGELAETALSMLSGLADAQAAVASYTPLLAARQPKPASVAGRSLRVDTFSASLWPSAGAANAGVEAPARAPLDRLGKPFSLPVEANRYSLLCQQLPEPEQPRMKAVFQKLAGARAAVLEGAPASASRQALRALGLPEKESLAAIVERLAELANGGARGVFCVPAGERVEQLESVARMLRGALRSGAAPSPGALGSAPTLAEAQHAWRQLQHSWTSSGDDRLDARPAKVWSLTQNGDLFMRSAALLPLDGTLTGSAPDSALREPSPSGWRDTVGIVAHAEMYFDCPDTWEHCAANAAWQLAWTARLRRVHPSSVLLDDAEARAGRTLAPGNGALLLPPLEPWAIEQTLPFLLSKQLENPASVAAAPPESLARFLLDAAELDSTIH
jgi:hypothetical protein